MLQHYLLEFDLAGVPQRWVLRTDGATKLGIGLSRAREFALQRTLFRAGLKVAEPLFMCCDPAVLGAPFFLMRFLPGDARGVALVARGAQPALAEELGRELARLHALELRYALHCLPAPPHDAAEVRIAELEALLAADDDPHPVGEWALRWLKQMKPDPARVALCHGDFRTGNYLVAEGRLAGVLDWDFAHWGDPDEDIAWFCAKAWRFGAVAREAGGLAPRADFYRGYEVVSGRRIEASRVRYWEVMAALRWLVIALKQRDRFLRQGERSLDLALTGRRVAECELELLLLILGGRAPKEANWISRGDGEPPACAPENPMRDRPSGATLAALAREVGGEEEFVTRCFAIAEREARLGDAVFAPVSASLDARYGKGNGAALTQLVAELRAGAFDRPGDARQWL
ncbi:MAG TPA: phosphotransferase family protein, partial [Caulobacterales bacterium]|nr:phosphotransferase family protein [Caulobacterales bacterium]